MSNSDNISEPGPVLPDDRDWTFVITEGCVECGFRPFDHKITGDRLRATIPVWHNVLASPNASTRPSRSIWSAVEYGCHVRDVACLFRERLHLMLSQNNPEFDNWNQDKAAIQNDYFHQDPTLVIVELENEFNETANAFDYVRADQWRRPGRRSNGSVFTVATFAVYFIHDIEHHVYDVSHGLG